LSVKPCETSGIEKIITDSVIVPAPPLAQYSTRTTQLYDHRPDDVTLDEVERVLIAVRELCGGCRIERTRM
jgi:hypothetical protein